MATPRGAAEPAAHITAHIPWFGFDRASQLAFRHLFMAASRRTASQRIIRLHRTSPATHMTQGLKEKLAMALLIGGVTSLASTLTRMHDEGIESKARAEAFQDCRNRESDDLKARMLQQEGRRQ